MSKARAKGTAWETRLVGYLREHGFPEAMRHPLSGRLDRGDVANVPGVVFEAKNAKAIDLAGWVDEMVKEKANAGAPIGVVVFPRRNRQTERAYCVIELRDFVELIK